MIAAPLRVAVLGAGTVGEQVVRGLIEGAHGGANGRLASAAGGKRIELGGVAVRDVARAVGRGLPADRLTDAPAHLVAAPETDVVVELMGGDEPARTLVAAALGAGKAVVTANKHLVAHHGPELEAIARRTGAAFRFEAAVGGGIPILGPLAADLAANRVLRVRGIVNGTTNYILTEMAAGRGTYEGVLRQAQEQGYAEADPSGDVEGRDAANKLVILARLAFDRWIDPDDVVARPPGLRRPGGPGITGVTVDELAGAAALGLTLRLLAVARETGAPSVVPTAVPVDSPLGGTHGVRNRIEVRAEPVGDLGFDGPGAGGAATSSAVLGDLVAVARGLGSSWAGRPPAEAARRPVEVVGTDDGADQPASSEAPRRAVDGAARAWFALLAGARAGNRLGDGIAARAGVPAGLAVRTDPMTAEEGARVLLAVAPDTADATLYPIDD